jgi:dCTP deaminase
MLEQMLGNCIKGGDKRNINPASIDLSLHGEVYRVDRLFQPRKGETVRRLLKDLGGIRHSLSRVFERGVTYLAKLNEKLELPPDVYGYCNPKSSTGRTFVHVSVVADCCNRYDAAAPAGFKGELWLFITPQPIPVRLSEGERLSQLRLFNRDTRFRQLELEIADRQHTFLCNSEGNPIPQGKLQASDDDGSLILTLDMGSEVVGYECRETSQVLDFSSRNLDPREFFAPVYRRNGSRVELNRDSFYLLSTAEAVRVAPWYSCEMVPMDERSGEFRSHYAGFIDPGFGWESDGNGFGSTLTLEVRPYRNLTFRLGQAVAKIRFEQMVDHPEVHYDAMNTSNYRAQRGAKFSKHFRPWS